MKTYRFHHFSPLIGFISLLLTTFGTALLARMIFSDHKVLVNVFTIALLALCAYCQKFISISVVEIRIENGVMYINWVKHNPFFKRKNRKISLFNIVKYKTFSSARSPFLLLKIILKNGTWINFQHYYFSRKDGFEDFTRYIHGIVTQNKNDSQNLK